MRIEHHPNGSALSTTRFTPDVFVMETVGGEYLPLVSTGHNTIRKLSAKYENLRPGDRVTMAYVEKAGDTNAIAVEQLVVSSVVTGPLDIICRKHWHKNHGMFLLREGCYEAIKSIYGGDDTGLFLAIYF